MKKEKKDKDFVHKPVYPGGMKAMRQFLKTELRYPPEARATKVEGTVYLKYQVDHLGKVAEVKVISGLGYGCDEEATRLVKLLQFKVAKNRKMKVLFNKSIRIHFRLPKKASPSLKATPTSGGIAYEFIPTEKPKTEKAKGPDKEGYSYTIEW